MQRVLTQCQPFPGDGHPVDNSYKPGSPRFLVERRDRGFLCIYDRVQGFETNIHIARLHWDSFSIGEWFAERCTVNSGLDKAGTWVRTWLSEQEWDNTLMGAGLESIRQPGHSSDEGSKAKQKAVELSGIQVDKNKYHSLQRNAAQVKGNQRVLPKPIVVKVTVNGHPAHALLNSRSLGDFISTTFANQLGVRKTILDTPLALQLAVQGSQSRVNSRVTIQFGYQDINESCTEYFTLPHVFRPDLGGI